MIANDRAARIDLAAAMRLAVVNDFHEAIDNHFTLSVPGKPDRFLVNPFGLHWSEIRASDFLEASCDGRILAGGGIAEPTALCIHGPLHERGIACVMHTHMPYATALTQLDDMTVEMTGQTAIGFHGAIAYDYDYAGLGLDREEGHRLADVLGDRRVLMMANHGVLVTGASVAEAFHDLYFLERVCRTQMLAMATGRSRRHVDPAIVERTAGHFRSVATVGEDTHTALHFAALKRLLDRVNPGYAE